MGKARNGEQKGHKHLHYKIFYDGQKLHEYLCSLHARGNAKDRGDFVCVSYLKTKSREHDQTNVIKKIQPSLSHDLAAAILGNGPTDFPCNACQTRLERKIELHAFLHTRFASARFVLFCWEGGEGGGDRGPLISYGIGGEDRSTRTKVYKSKVQGEKKQKHHILSKER